MLLFEKNNVDKKQALSELMNGSGVFVVKNVYTLDQINEARDIVNKFADSQEQKESHFNAEAEAGGKIHLQQRVWNLFGKGKIFSDLLTDEIIFDLILVDGILMCSGDMDENHLININDIVLVIEKILN